MLMKTGATPSSVDSAKFKKEYTARMAELQANGLSFSESSKQAAKEAAQTYGLAYYEGSHGIFQRVHPPS